MVHAAGVLRRRRLSRLGMDTGGGVECIEVRGFLFISHTVTCAPVTALDSGTRHCVQNANFPLEELNIYTLATQIPYLICMPRRVIIMRQRACICRWSGSKALAWCLTPSKTRKPWRTTGTWPLWSTTARKPWNSCWRRKRYA